MKKAVYAALAALALVAAGCVGKNNAYCLHRGLADWNRTYHNEKWVNEAIFVGLHIIPVYQIFRLADILVFNSIDFWTGDNPVKGAFAGVDARGCDYRIVSNGDGTATLSYKGQSCTLTPMGDTVALSKDGVVLGTFSRQGSLVIFTGTDGSVQSALR